MLDVNNCDFNGTFQIQGFKMTSIFRKLENLNLGFNKFNDSLITSLSVLPSLKVLVLSANRLSTFQGFASFHHLEVLDLGGNIFVGSIPSSAIRAISSLRAISLASNMLNGSIHGFCELKNLHELDLSDNMFDEILPQCFNNLSSLKSLDISLNRFSGILVPSLISNLTSLEYIDVSHNKFQGSFPFSSFINHTKLEAVLFGSDNGEFEVETEEPIGWIPMFQLKRRVISSCNINKRKGSVFPGFLLHQHKLQDLQLPHNSLKGQFPIWLIENNTDLVVLKLRDNSFSGIICMPKSENAAIVVVLDMSKNQLMGTIPDHIPKFFPNIGELNLSMNAINGSIPSSVGELSKLWVLDLSNNELSGEVPKGLFARFFSQLFILNLSKNTLQGQVLSVNLSLGGIGWVNLGSNNFTGEIGNWNVEMFHDLQALDISNNFFTGIIPGWFRNITYLSELVVRNNSFKGQFPCVATAFSLLDISQNYFSGPISTCLKLKHMAHLHLGSNRFTGSIPNYFRNLTNILTLDIGDNNLSGTIPEFLGELSSLRILLLRKNNFTGHIPKQLCQLSNASFMDLSSNSLSGSIPSCLQNLTGASSLAFRKTTKPGGYMIISLYMYNGELTNDLFIKKNSFFNGSDDAVTKTADRLYNKQDEVDFTTKGLSLRYHGDILDNMTGLDLSCNKLTGEIPEELGLLTKIKVLNLSHNPLSGSIPVSFANLTNIESIDLSYNGLSGRIPSELIQLKQLSTFFVSHNNLSDRLPPFTDQFGTFSEASYEGNPFLCGLPLVKKCRSDSPTVTNPSDEETQWYDIDMTCFYGSSSSTCVVFLLGFVAVLYANPYWRKRWLDWVEDCMFRCYYFLYDLAMNPSMIFSK